MIRSAIFAICLTASSVVAQASTTDRVLASTVIIGVQESAASGPSLYALPGQRPTWFRRLVHRLSYGSADVQRNAFAGEYYEAGAGAVIQNGRILTAAHVVNIQGAAFTVRFRDGRRARAELEAIAPHHDAAVLRLTQSDTPRASVIGTHSRTASRRARIDHR
ncbi:serine protease (plasmid) [Xanthomonas citri pv. glycines]|uniref:S1 family peptidase n=1 Tax=Xanthomonas citri TaxID=346 RepID=UPI001F1A630F|nr:serine protease [Xanthomonas citri]UIX78441.1 serine protease [Xanthomonas citri pv. glycines]